MTACQLLLLLAASLCISLLSLTQPVACQFPLTPTFYQQGLTVSALATDGRLLYAADQLNGRISVLDTTGSVLRRFSHPSPGGVYGQFAPSSLALDGAGRLWAADSNGFQVVAFNTSGAPIAACDVRTAYSVQGPTAIAFAPGYTALYVADRDSPEVTVWSVAADARCSYDRHFTGGVTPQSMAISSSGLVFIADQDLDRVQVFDLSDAVLQTIALPGDPSAIAVDDSDVLTVSLSTSHSNKTGLLLICPPPQYACSGSVAPSVTLGSILPDPAAQGTYYCGSSHTIVRVNSTGQLTSVFPQPWAALSGVNLYMTIDASDRVLASDLIGISISWSNGSNIYYQPAGGITPMAINRDASRFCLAFTTVHTVGHYQYANYSVDCFDVAIGDAGVHSSLNWSTPVPGDVVSLYYDFEDNLYCGDYTNQQVIKWSSSGALLFVYGQDTGLRLTQPISIAVDAQQTLYVTDQSSSFQVQVVQGQAVVVATYTTGSSLFVPAALAIDSAGRLYVSEVAFSNGEDVTFDPVNRVVLYNNAGGVLALYVCSRLGLTNIRAMVLDSHDALYVLPYEGSNFYSFEAAPAAPAARRAARCRQRLGSGRLPGGHRLELRQAGRRWWPT